MSEDGGVTLLVDFLSYFVPCGGFQGCVSDFIAYSTSKKPKQASLFYLASQTCVSLLPPANEVAGR